MISRNEYILNEQKKSCDLCLRMEFYRYDLWECDSLLFELFLVEFIFILALKSSQFLNFVSLESIYADYFQQTLAVLVSMYTDTECGRTLKSAGT